MTEAERELFEGVCHNLVNYYSSYHVIFGIDP
jgi:hypothetical protein